ncbi:MarR family winged helix-turn-helix transcriptional regulator [Rubellimicrobium arenae]|uniref:MarR family winged helix-turn-helix transcriptional regulator n=1 Tax=Rubellimicrobium arenae TaxID=2817372 RepID=UPI001B3087D6|nr:MarR family transcriptional regulator [Rubellimicrobium arenae]
MQASADLGPSALGALVTLGEYPGESLGGLSRILGLTHSATVRLADDLERRGLVQREGKADRRSVGLLLTEQGIALRSAAMRARAEVLEGAVSVLEDDERGALERGMARLLQNFATSRAVADHICRLCDEEACGRNNCPVERRAVEIDGP